MHGISLAVLAAALIGIAPVAAGETASPSVPALTAAHAAASAMEFSAQRRHARRRTRVRVTPLRRVYRRCVDWYNVEHRPSGTVITPQMRCWWTRR